MFFKQKNHDSTYPWTMVKQKLWQKNIVGLPQGTMSCTDVYCLCRKFHLLFLLNGIYVYAGTKLKRQGCIGKEKCKARGLQKQRQKMKQ